MSTKFSCGDCGDTFAANYMHPNLEDEEIYCPGCCKWTANYIATTTPDHAQVVDVVLVKYYCSECDHELPMAVVGTENYKNEVKCTHCKNMVYVYEKITDTPATATTDNHSEHYQKMHIEPFDVMEQRMISAKEMDETPLFCLALALKHIMRAGLKPGQPWRKDIEKAQNYLNRALTGKWLGDDDE